MTRPQPRLVFLDAATFGDASLQRFTARWNCTIHDVSAPDEVPERLRDHTVAIINKVTLGSAALNSAAMHGLKLVAVAATGTDNVDRETAKKHGIRVCNVPGYATQSVAQFTMALVLELATRVGGYGGLVRGGTWQRSRIFTLFDYPSLELKGKVLGVVGYGNIGRAVAEMARCLGMEVLVSARPGTAGPVPPGRVSLEELLQRADFVTLHCPLTADTQNLINSRTLASMKPTAFLVNTARGALIDESALIDALRTGRLAGAAVDVLTEEPPFSGHPMIEAVRELPNLLITPHCAWTAREARKRLLDEVLQNIAAFFEGRERNLVV